jgi:purine-binding chemotaxis protein CheW
VSPGTLEGGHALIVATGALKCAIPLGHVLEIMRPLAIVPIAGTPAFVLGVAVIRGAPIPVVDLEALLQTGDTSAVHERFVTLKVGERRLALAVDGVSGVRELDLAQMRQLPPLLRDIRGDVLAAIGIADTELLAVLRTARLVPEETWAAFAATMDVG